MVNLNDNSFAEVVSAGYVLVDFMADWCVPCKTVGSILDQFAKNVKYKNILFCKVNVDHCPGLVDKYHITNLPTVMLFINGVAAAFLSPNHCTVHDIKQLLNTLK